MQQFWNLFWNQDVWLPPNVTWSDMTALEANPDVHFRKFSHLWYPIPATLLIVTLRTFIERLVFRPLGIYLGLRVSRHKKAATNDFLEEVFRRNKRLTHQEMQDMAGVMGMSVRQVERWFRIRRLQNKPNTLQKFCETGWRCLYYLSVFLYGSKVLWNKPWMWDIKYCWYNYPYHWVDDDVWWYYMTELTFYWALCVSQFFDAKRKDFCEMMVHHITTIALLAFSWTCNLIRVGTLVLIIHDVADIFLEAAKMCKYTKYQRMCDALFACFALIWIMTRLGVYPTWILYSTTIEAPQIVEMFPAYYIFNGLLSILLVLHVIWTYYILKIVYKAIYSGQTDDVRSDSDEETVSSEPEQLLHPQPAQPASSD